MSPSIDAWLVRKAPGPIHRGDFVSFTLSHPLAGPKPVDVTKMALCLPGDRIDWIEKPSSASGPIHPGEWDGWYYCNGKLLGISKPYGHNGQKLDHWRPMIGTIPPGMIYVGSSHASGFDTAKANGKPLLEIRAASTLTPCRPAPPIPAPMKTMR